MDDQLPESYTETMPDTSPPTDCLRGFCHALCDWKPPRGYVVAQIQAWVDIEGTMNSAVFIRKHGVCATACFGVDSRPGNLKTVAEIHASLDCSVANWLEARLKTL